MATLVCGDQEGPALVACRDQLEEHAGLGLVLADIGEVIEDHQVVSVEPVDEVLQGGFAARDLHALDQVRGSGEQHTVSVLDQGEPDGGGEMTLASHRRPDLNRSQHGESRHAQRRQEFLSSLLNVACRHAATDGGPAEE